MQDVNDEERVVRETHHHHYYERPPVLVSRARLVVGAVAAVAAGVGAFFSPSWASALSVMVAIIAIVITL